MPLPAAKAPTVLLVDDDRALRLSLKFLLELDGFVVDTVDSGEALLAHALPGPPACLVLDQHLGGLTGLEALAQLRDRGVSLPAILITGRPESGFAFTTAKLGAVVVEKPLLGGALRAAIDAAFNAQKRPQDRPI